MRAAGEENRPAANPPNPVRAAKRPHGDLVIASHEAGFIDFGNLYTLDKRRGDGVNEQREPFRVILGAAFRDKGVVPKGFDRLMSPEGGVRLEKEDIVNRTNAIREDADGAGDGKSCKTGIGIQPRPGEEAAVAAKGGF